MAPPRQRAPVSDATLETLAALVDDGLLLIGSATGGQHQVRLFSEERIRSANSDKMPFQVNSEVLAALATRRFVVAADLAALEERLRVVGERIGRKPPFVLDGRGRHLAWYDKPWEVSLLGRDALEGMRDRLAAIRSARAEAEAAPPVFLATRRQRSSFERGLGIGVVGLYRVVRETDNRFYVEHRKPEDGLDPEDERDYDGALSGSGRNLWVDKDKVAAYGITPRQFDAMRRATTAYDAAIAAAKAQAEEEMAPIRRRHADRMKQLEAELEDGLKEAVEPDPASSPRP